MGDSGEKDGGMDTASPVSSHVQALEVFDSEGHAHAYSTLMQQTEKTLVFFVRHFM